ncbi:hypothetical protein JZ751_014613, partial [Albula glossodonta]
MDPLSEPSTASLAAAPFLLFLPPCAQLTGRAAHRQGSTQPTVKAVSSVPCCYRYVHALYLGVQSRWRGEHERRHFYWRMMFESADINMLRLLETFLKSAPQLVLQLSIMVNGNQIQPLQAGWPGLSLGSAAQGTADKQWQPSSRAELRTPVPLDPPCLPHPQDLMVWVHHKALIQLAACSITCLKGESLSASASLVSLAWMIASYQKVLRDSRDDKMSMSYKAVIVQMLWHLFTIGARTIAFALFASVFQLYFGIFIVTHWCIMTFWIIQGETDFCMSKWEEIIYNMVVGIIYIFCWFNVKEGRTRCRMFIYYFITLAENATLTALWYLYRGQQTPDFCALIVVCVVVCSFALGMFFMFVYYCLLHPNGPIFGGQWGCVEDRAVVEPCATPAPPPDVVTSPPRTLQRTTGADREQVPGDRDSSLPVFQVRPSVPPTPVPRTPRTEGPVIRIDLPRKKYPAWDAHFIDRRLRKTILVLETTSPVTPRLQYRSLGSPKEVMEYETTVVLLTQQERDTGRTGRERGGDCGGSGRGFIALTSAGLDPPSVAPPATFA